MQDKTQGVVPSKTLIFFLRVLLVMIMGLMALGAGVRAMNAGLACPDWPLCFGKVIPDFHPGVWFEFVHRAYAGLVALVFAGVCSYVLFSRRVNFSAKRAAIAGFMFLFFQIAAGALTVLWKVKWFAVTSHLMLATLFFCSVLWVLLSVEAQVEKMKKTEVGHAENKLGNGVQSAAPLWVKALTVVLVFGVLSQILVGGIVASTYAGAVCVDWPLCGGQWIPTLSGPIGYQIIHRFVAYGLALAVLIFAMVIHGRRSAHWVTRSHLVYSRAALAIVFLQVAVGIANLVLFMPALLTVFHQSVAIVLLGTLIKISYMTVRLKGSERKLVKDSAGGILVGATYVVDGASGN